METPVETLMETPMETIMDTRGGGLTKIWNWGRRLLQICGPLLS